jgi:hypothetical protein
LNDLGSSQAQDMPGNHSFFSATKWLVQTILSDAIKMGVGWLVTKSQRIHAIVRSIPFQSYVIYLLLMLQRDLGELALD